MEPLNKIKTQCNCLFKYLYNISLDGMNIRLRSQKSIAAKCFGLFKDCADIKTNTSANTDLIQCSSVRQGTQDTILIMQACLFFF